MTTAAMDALLKTIDAIIDANQKMADEIAAELELELDAG
jgi:hypothetical protein